MHRIFGWIVRPFLYPLSGRIPDFTTGYPVEYPVWPDTGYPARYLKITGIKEKKIITKII
jgi:hypothetical protein